MVPLLAQGTLTKEFHILVNKGLKKKSQDCGHYQSHSLFIVWLCLAKCACRWMRMYLVIRKYFDKMWKSLNTKSI